MRKFYFALISFFSFYLLGSNQNSKSQFDEVYPDARGKTLTLKNKPRRIVSASIASDEILWLILNKAKNLDSLVGVSYLATQDRYSHISTEVESVPHKVGISLESYVKAKPDLLVLASFNRPELIQQIEQLSMPVYVLNDFREINDIVIAIRALSSLVGEKEAGKLIEKEFIEQLKKLKENASAHKNHPKLLSIVGEQAVMGKGTLFDAMLRYSGAVNASSHLDLYGWPKLGDEALIMLNPDYLVVPEEGAQNKDLLATLKRRPSTRDWNAVKKCALIRIPGRNLSAASPFILEGILRIRSQLANTSFGSVCGN